MMTTIELIKKINEIKELESLIKDAQAEVENLKDEIKAEMNNKEEMKCGRYIIRHKIVSTDRFDSKTFREACPDIYKMYITQSVSKRFTITG